MNLVLESSEQHDDYKEDEDLLNLLVLKGFEDKTMEGFEDFIFVFDDKLDSNQKLIDPFFIRVRHKNWMFGT